MDRQLAHRHAQSLQQAVHRLAHLDPGRARLIRTRDDHRRLVERAEEDVRGRSRRLRG
jgi:hypothetical protein